MTDTKEYNYIFYTFICNDPNITDCYVGSTKAFRERKRRHKSNCNLETASSHNVKIYQTIRANGGWNNWEMKPIDTKLCTKLQARIHETKLMEERQTTLNMCKAYVSEEQRKEQKKEHDKKRYEQHKDKILEQQKEYQQKNRDKLNAHQNEYYHQNKDKINARSRELRALKKLENSF